MSADLKNHLSSEHKNQTSEHKNHSSDHKNRVIDQKNNQLSNKKNLNCVVGGGGDTGGSGAASSHAPNRLVGAEWIILQGLRSGELCEDVPSKFEGYIMKSRKWPMKGWHKVT